MISHEVFLDFNEAIFEDNLAEFRRLLGQFPDAARHVSEKSGFPTLLHVVANRGKFDFVKVLVEAGSDINFQLYGTRTPLGQAVSNGYLEIAKYLIANGAKAGIDRPLISAIRLPPPQDIEFVNLLVENGALINECYHPYDDKKQPQINPLSWAILHGKHDIAEYLRAKGATMPPGQNDPGTPTVADLVVAYFADKFGPVQPLAQQEIVPTGSPIAIHVVPPSREHKQITLFTTGMSERPMKVPANAEKMRYAELMITLPADWPIPGLASSNRSLLGWLGLGKPKQEPPGGALWPFPWLRSIACYPHENKTWLGGPAVVFANGNPPQPLAPGLPFTSFLLMSVDEVPRGKGEVVQIYQLFPLYTEERALEMAEGIPALLRALDAKDVSWVVDPNRPNVCSG